MTRDEFPDSSPTTKLLSAGDQLGHYEIVEMIGSGGMGQVYRAHDKRLSRDVALKVLLNVFQERDSLNRFQREARAASALSHPNICAVYDVGESDHRPFLVMEFLEGKTLKEFMGGEPLALDAVRNIGTQIADALEAAHGKGIIHRDIKSGNVMITGRRHVKVLDFGLAKLAAQAQSDETLRGNTLSASGVVMGTPHYLAPEILEGAQADARTDIWALGIVLYEMIAGKLPFIGPTTLSIASMILREPVPPLPENVPFALRSIVDRCLAKRPDDRYQHASEVRIALEQLQSVPAASSLTSVESTGLRRPLSAGRRRWLWACAVLVAAAVGGFFVWSRLPENEPRLLSNGGHPSANLEANDAFELAQQFQTVQNDIPRAQQMLERALALDPKFVEALRQHATTYAILILNGYSNDTSLLYKAENELRQVSQMSPDLASLPSAWATIYITQGRKELISWQDVDRALRNDPSNINVRTWRGIALWLAGENRAASQEFRTILNYRPLYGPARMFLAEILREDGDLQTAIRELDKVLEQAPNNISAIQNMTLAYLDNGELEKAGKLLEDRRPIFSGNYLWRTLWALWLASANRREEALQAMDAETLKFAAAAFPSTLIVSEFYALMGEPSKAIEWLERTVRNGDERTAWFRKSQRLASIRKDPRFQQIIDSVESRRK